MKEPLHHVVLLQQGCECAEERLEPQLTSLLASNVPTQPLILACLQVGVVDAEDEEQEHVAPPLARLPQTCKSRRGGSLELKGAFRTAGTVSWACVGPRLKLTSPGPKHPGALAWSSLVPMTLTSNLELVDLAMESCLHRWQLIKENLCAPWIALKEELLP